MRLNREQVRYPWMVTVGVAIAGLLCVWGSLAAYEAEAAYQQQYRDPYMISMQFTRLGGLAAAVPENATLGYLTDAAAGSVIETSMFLAAQYVLAPRLLEKGNTHEWVLGNFTRPGDFAGLGQRNGLRLRQDFGNGVVLYRRER
jgi:hypothetical protein